MPVLCFLEAQQKRTDRTVRLCALRARNAVDVLLSESRMPETSTDNTRTKEGSRPVAITKIDQQIEQIRSLAERHYPDDESARQQWLVDRLIQRLREYDAKFVALEVREATK